MASHVPEVLLYFNETCVYEKADRIVASHVPEVLLYLNETVYTCV